MFIQCQHCQAKYSIDEQKIPDDKSFVKCSNCSKPILLSKQPETGPHASPEKVLVECENCRSQYMILSEKFSKGSLRVRCGKCSHLFEVTHSNSDSEREPPPESADKPSNREKEEDDFHTDSMAESPSTNDIDIGLGSISIPEENKIEADSLFDIFNDEDTDMEISGLSGGKLPIEKEDVPPPSSSDPTEEYLKSVDIEDDSEFNESGDDVHRTVSDEQKQKFFLKPSPKQEDTKQPKEIDDALSDLFPEIQDETEETALDSHGEGVGMLETKAAAPPSEDSGGTGEVSGKRRVAKAIAATFFVLLLFFLVVMGCISLFYRNGPMAVLETLQSSGYRKKAQIREPLKGKMIVHKASNRRIFVLQGSIENFVPPEPGAEAVKVRGTLYDSQSRIIAESFAFAGKTSPLSKLERLSREAIKSFYSNQLGASDGNLDLNSGQVVIPFQIVFFDVPGKIAKLEAKIVDYSKNDQ